MTKELSYFFKALKVSSLIYFENLFTQGEQRPYSPTYFMWSRYKDEAIVDVVGPRLSASAQAVLTAATLHPQQLWQSQYY